MARANDQLGRGDAVSPTTNPRAGSRSSMLVLLIFLGALILLVVWFWAKRAEKPVKNNPDSVSWISQPKRARQHTV